MLLTSTFARIDIYRFRFLMVTSLFVFFEPSFVKKTFLSAILFIDFLFFGFVTQPTEDSGTIITINKMQSLTNLYTVVVQLYLSIVLVMIIGNYLVSIPMK